MENVRMIKENHSSIENTKNKVVFILHFPLGIFVTICNVCEYYIIFLKIQTGNNVDGWDIM